VEPVGSGIELRGAFGLRIAVGRDDCGRAGVEVVEGEGKKRGSGKEKACKL
jgi:hypothetical protein